MLFRSFGEVVCCWCVEVDDDEVDGCGTSSSSLIGRRGSLSCVSKRTVRFRFGGGEGGNEGEEIGRRKSPASL